MFWCWVIFHYLDILKFVCWFTWWVFGLFSIVSHHK
jgi:hypothetical protein